MNDLIDIPVSGSGESDGMIDIPVQNSAPAPTTNYIYAPNKATWATAFGELFEHPVHYIPVLNMIELIPTIDELLLSRKVMKGEASIEEQAKFDRILSEKQSKSEGTAGYKIWSTALEMIPWAGDFFTGGALLKGTARGGLLASTRVLKEGVEEAITVGTKASEAMMEKGALSAIERGAAKAVGRIAPQDLPKTIEEALLNITDNTIEKATHTIYGYAKQQFKSESVAAAEKAAAEASGQAIKEITKKEALEATARLIKRTAIEAPLRTLMTPWRTAMEATEFMTPKFALTVDDENQIHRVLVETGDSLPKALLKAFYDQSVQTFSEGTGAALTALGGIYGPALASRALGFGLLKKAGSVLAKKSNIPVVQGIRNVLQKHFFGDDGMLVKAGWNGMLNEMFEERVADAMLIPFEMAKIPSLGDLVIEAAAFALNPLSIGVNTFHKVNELAYQDFRNLRGEVDRLKAIGKTDPDYATPVAKEQLTKINTLVDGLIKKHKDVPETRMGKFTKFMRAHTEELSISEMLKNKMGTTIEQLSSLSKWAELDDPEAVHKALAMRLNLVPVENEDIQLIEESGIKGGWKVGIGAIRSKPRLFVDLDRPEIRAATDEQGRILKSNLVDLMNRYHVVNFLKASPTGHISSHLPVFGSVSGSSVKNWSDLDETEKKDWTLFLGHDRILEQGGAQKAYERLQTYARSNPSATIHITPELAFLGRKMDIEKITGHVLPGEFQDKQIVDMIQPRGITSEDGSNIWLPVTRLFELSGVAEELLESQFKQALGTLKDTPQFPAQSWAYRARETITKKLNDPATPQLDRVKLERALSAIRLSPFEVVIGAAKSQVFGIEPSAMFDYFSIPELLLPEEAHAFFRGLVSPTFLSTFDLKAKPVVPVNVDPDHEDADWTPDRSPHSMAPYLAVTTGGHIIPGFAGMTYDLDFEQDEIVEPDFGSNEDWMPERGGQGSFARENEQKVKEGIKAYRQVSNALAGRLGPLRDSIRYLYNVTRNRKPGGFVYAARNGQYEAWLSHPRKDETLLRDVLKELKFSDRKAASLANFYGSLEVLPIVKVIRRLSRVEERTVLGPLQIMPANSYNRIDEWTVMVNKRLEQFSQTYFDTVVDPLFQSVFSTSGDQLVIVNPYNQLKFIEAMTGIPLAVWSTMKRSWLNERALDLARDYQLYLADKINGIDRVRRMIRDHHVLNTPKFMRDRGIKPNIEYLSLQASDQEGLDRLYRNVNDKNQNAYFLNSHLLNWVRRFTGKEPWQVLRVVDGMLIKDDYGHTLESAQWNDLSPQKKTGRLPSDRDEVIQAMWNEGYISLGQFGDKTTGYFIKVKPLSIEEAREKYTVVYASAAPADQAFMASPDTLAGRDAYTWNYAYYFDQFARSLDGSYSQYETRENFGKRRSLDPTGGVTFAGPLKVLTIAEFEGDRKRYDGLGFFSTLFGKRYAHYMGEDYLMGQVDENGEPIANHIKGHVRSNTRMDKVNWLRADAFKHLGGDYAKLAEIFERTGVDLIVFDSGAKLKNKADVATIYDNDPKSAHYGEIVNTDLSDYVREIQGEDFYTTQQLGGKIEAYVAELTKQELFNTIHLPSSDKRQEYRNRIQTEYIQQGSLDAMRVLSRVTESDLTQAILKNGESPSSPLYVHRVNQYRTYALERMLKARTMRLTTQLISNGNTGLQAARLTEDGKKVRTARMALNIKGARSYSIGGFETPEAAVGFIQSKRHLFDDMFEIDEEGVLTDTVQVHELDQEADGTWSIPGEPAWVNYVPADSLQSHPIARIRNGVISRFDSIPGSINDANYMVPDQQSQQSAGKDFDGDRGLLDLLYRDSKGRLLNDESLGGLYNRIQLLKLRDFQDPRFFPFFQQDIRPIVDIYKSKAKEYMRRRIEWQLGHEVPNLNEVQMLPAVNLPEYERDTQWMYTLGYRALSIFARGNAQSDMFHHWQGYLTKPIGLVYTWNGKKQTLVIERTSGAARTEQPEDIYRVKAFQGTGTINITVDNIKEPIAADLAFDRERAPLFLAAMLGAPSKGSLQDIEAFASQVMDYLHSEIPTEYAHLKRETRNLGMNRAQWLLNERLGAYAERMNLTDELEGFMRLQSLANELFILSQMTNYVANDSIDVDLYNLFRFREDLQQFNSELSSYRFNIDPRTSPFWIPVQRQLDFLQKIHSNDPLMTLAGRDAIEGIRNKHGNIAKKKFNALIRTLRKELGDEAVADFPYLVVNETNLAQWRQKWPAARPFFDALTVGKDRLELIAAVADLRGEPEANIYGQYRAAWDAIPREMQDQLVKHMINNFGLSMSTLQRSPLILVSDAYRKDVLEPLLMKVVDGWNGNETKSVPDQSNIQEQTPNEDLPKNPTYDLVMNNALTGISMPNLVSGAPQMHEALLKSLRTIDTWRSEGMAISRLLQRGAGLLPGIMPAVYKKDTKWILESAGEKQEFDSEASAREAQSKLLEKVKKDIGALTGADYELAELATKAVTLALQTPEAEWADTPIIQKVEWYTDDDGRKRKNLIWEEWNGQQVSISDVIKLYDHLAGQHPNRMMKFRTLYDRAYQWFDQARTWMNDFIEPLQSMWLNDWKLNGTGYAPNIYKTQSQEERAWAEKESTNRSKPRTFLSYNDAAVMKGRSPLDTRISKLIEIWADSVSQAAANKYFMSMSSQMVDINGKPIFLLRPRKVELVNIPTGSDEEQARKAVTARYTEHEGVVPTQFYSRQAENIVKYVNFQRRMREDSRKEKINQDRPIADELERLIRVMQVENPTDRWRELKSNFTSIDRIYVEDSDAYNFVLQYLGDRWKNNAIVTWEHWNARSKAAGLSLSFFHPAAILEAFSGSMGLSIKEGVWPWNFKRYYRDMTNLNRELMQNPERYRDAGMAGLKMRFESPDVDLNILNEDFRKGAEYCENHGWHRIANGLKAFRQFKMGMDTWLWEKLQPTLKVYTYENIVDRYTSLLTSEGVRYDGGEVRESAAMLTNGMYGGQEWAKLPWMTPKTQQVMHLWWFAADWTYSSLDIAGFTRIPFVKEWFRTYHSEIMSNEMWKRYWPGMLVIALGAIPNMIQALIWAVTRPFGDPDDQPVTLLNETGKQMHVDLTPLLRLMPFYPDSETGKRRMYFRWGKQAWEVWDGWLTQFGATFMNKQSSSVRLAFELMTGSTGSGWKLPFKDTGFLGWFTTPEDGFMGSRLGYVVEKFVPMSLTSIMEGNVTAFFAPTSKGMSAGRATTEIAKVLTAYADESFFSPITGSVKGHNNLQAAAGNVLDAIARNGYDPHESLVRARSHVLTGLYDQFYEALNSGDQPKLERTARAIHRVNGTADSLLRSIQRKYEIYVKPADPTLQPAIESIMQM